MRILDKPVWVHYNVALRFLAGFSERALPLSTSTYTGINHIVFFCATCSLFSNWTWKARPWD